MAPATSDTIVINEVAPSGPGGSTDEFVELRNLTDQDLSLDGWRFSICGSTGSPTRVAVLDATLVVPANGHFLINGSGYSDRPGHFAFSDAGYNFDVPDDGGWQIDDGLNVVDSVGLGDNGCVEGTGVEPWAPQCDRAAFTAPEAATRDAAGTDTDQNSVDFTCQPATPTGSAD